MTRTQLAGETRAFRLGEGRLQGYVVTWTEKNSNRVVLVVEEYGR